MIKTRVTLALAAGSLLAFAAVGPADAAKKPSCKKKKEQKGCKLPSGAAYGATLPAGGSVGLSVDSGGWSVGVSGVDRGNGPCNRRFSRGGKEFRGRPKVGKTYSMNVNVRRPDSGVDNRILISGTVTITSAKKAKFKGTFSSQRSFRGNVFPACQRSFDLSGARSE